VQILVGRKNGPTVMVRFVMRVGVQVVSRVQRMESLVGLESKSRTRVLHHSGRLSHKTTLNVVSVHVRNRMVRVSDLQIKLRSPFDKV